MQDDEEDLIGRGGDGRPLDADDNAPVAADRLRSFVERVERLEEEKATLTADIKDVYGEAKGEGFDAKVLRKLVKLRTKDPEKRQAEETVMEVYMQALGMI